MSIINKMLQELDKRNGRPGGEVMPGDAIRSIKADSAWHLGRNALFLIVGLVVASLAAGAWWVQQRNRAFEASRAVVVAPPTSVAGSTSPTAVAQLAPDLAAPRVAVAASAASANAPAPMADSSSIPAAAASGKADVATTPGKAVGLAPPRMAAARSPNTPDEVEPLVPPPKAVAMSPKAAGGKTYSARQVSVNLFGEAVMLDQQGRREEAKVPLQQVLVVDPLDVQARQLLIRLQLDTGHVDEARALLAEGRRLLPEQTSFTLGLARLKVESGDVAGAIQILEAGLARAHNEPQYHAFLAALLLRAQRYDEAVQQYLVALRSDPANGIWLVGIGVALEGVGKNTDAAEAYRRAEGATSLTPEVATFLNERLAQLGR